MEKSKAKAIVAKAINDGGITIENGEIARHTDGYQYADALTAQPETIPTES